jgi:hypothetical protein
MHLAAPIAAELTGQLLAGAGPIEKDMDAIP